jgi:hypothetical protein
MPPTPDPDPLAALFTLQAQVATLAVLNAIEEVRREAAEARSVAALLALIASDADNPVNPPAPPTWRWTAEEVAAAQARVAAIEWRPEADGALVITLIHTDGE